jgi:maleate isomerase
MQNRTPARVGVLVPGKNPVPEREFARLDAEGVTFRFAGFFYPPRGTADFCSGLLEQMTAPLEELKTWGMDLLLVGCTTASIVAEPSGFESRLQELVRTPVITAATASREAIAAMGVKTLGVASPYGEANNRVIVDFLRNAGVETIALEGLGLDRSAEIWQGASDLSDRQVLDLCLRVNSLHADAVYLPATNVDSLLAIDEFERLTAKVAFSSVQASFWASLRKLGIEAPQRGAGRLLSKWY